MTAHTHTHTHTYTYVGCQPAEYVPFTMMCWSRLASITWISWSPVAAPSFRDPSAAARLQTWTLQARSAAAPSWPLSAAAGHRLCLAQIQGAQPSRPSALPRSAQPPPPSWPRPDLSSRSRGLHGGAPALQVAATAPPPFPGAVGLSHPWKLHGLMLSPPPALREPRPRSPCSPALHAQPLLWPLKRAGRCMLAPFRRARAQLRPSHSAARHVLQKRHPYPREARPSRPPRSCTSAQPPGAHLPHA
mmetsp:Transcript_97471/g.178681  ORF Transcript_97471/g.178681 Transcript_97471/m.178681 type:complete len:246 (-) Transcript_97471:1846-2583(-)